jgi:23S rRNA (cytidine1920-2'-O)/16S rRNA (cytidine1409-2'-O)-methyltransferase
MWGRRRVDYRLSPAARRSNRSRSDTGYGQLDFRLRQDPASAYWKTNARYLKREYWRFVDFITMDVSFISATGFTRRDPRSVSGCSRRKCPRTAFVLVKPQFEAGRAAVREGHCAR